MKCLKLYGKYDLRYSNTESSYLNENQVLVKVKSVGICRSDIHYFSEGMIGSIKITEPITPGHEFSGVVELAGKNVTGFKPGDRVAVDPSISCGRCEFCLRGDENLCPDVRFCGTPPIAGALSEFYIADESQLYLLPDNLSYDDGANLEPLGIALHSIKLSKLKDESNIALVGLGPIGLLIMQTLRQVYDKACTGFDKLDWRVNYSEKWSKESVLIETGNILRNKNNFELFNSKFDIVFEAAGSEEAVNFSMELAKPGGKVVLLGISPTENIKINSSLYRRKGLTLIGVRRMNNTYMYAIDLVKTGKISFEGFVTHRYKLEEGARAFKLVENYADNVIKAIIEL